MPPRLHVFQALIVFPDVHQMMGKEWLSSLDARMELERLLVLCDGEQRPEQVTAPPRS